MMNEKQASADAPRYARPSLGMRVALAWTAVLCSSTVICAGLGLFEMQARSASAARQGTTTSAGTLAGVQAANVGRGAQRG